ncbi:hypothetical protein P3X46_027861 [Hevea brasiliensis]|uniref:Fungal lipase-type domain-containing protein n=1 Tax=Hevea brasiliensis TaxID=3981 RepID=A0ABQ9L3R7_HEVBR|nr:hypothetical protein P3X46_027861 [Hevea brasiliensis]
MRRQPFPVFLESAGYCLDDVLLQKPKAGLLKPAFTIIHDKDSKCFLLLICGIHSIKDTLTAATGAVVPFHHSIVGHSLGGGTAALLTYVVWEQKEFSSSTCITFAPAACMTCDFAESGKHFITNIIYGSDLVPTFSAASVDNLPSSCLNDLWDQVEHTRVLNVVYPIAKARVAGAGALLCPVPRSTQNTFIFFIMAMHGAMMSLCGASAHSKVDALPEAFVVSESSETIVTQVQTKESVQNKLGCNSSSESGHDDTEEDGPLIPNDRVMNSSAIEDVTEGELWYELEKELQRHESEVDIDARAEEAAVAKENTVEENIITNAFETKSPIISADVSDSNQLESCILFPCLLPILLI